MISFIELQKISELSFECMFGLLYNVYLLYKMAATPNIDLSFPALNGTLFWVAGEIFTQHNTRCKLEDHCSFGSKFNVPVGFLSLRIRS